MIPQHSRWRAYSFGWLTLGLFVFSLIGHWIFGWYDFANEQQTRGQSADLNPYIVQMMRETLENWQSEFLQLLWQVGGLAFFLFLGSPQSKEENDRIEAKIDFILKRVDPVAADGIIAELDERYSGRNTDKPGAHLS